jgi:AraC-like DNA-binding protein
VFQQCFSTAIARSPFILVERPSTIRRWSTLTITAEAHAPPIGAGFGVLWPGDPLEVRHAGRTATLRPGDLMIVDRTLPIVIDGKGDWRATLLDLGDRRIGARVDDRKRFVGVALDGHSDPAQVVKRLWLLLHDIGALQLGHQDIGDELVEARMVEMLTDLTARLAARAMDTRISGYDAATIDRALVLIAANLSDPHFGVAELAGLMRVSARHLSSLFARTDTTTSQAILDARLTLAKQMLIDPVNKRRQIASIALACGFEDQSYFARCFRRNVGITPRAFRAAGGTPDIIR